MEFFKILSLIIGVVSLFLNLAKCAGDILNEESNNGSVEINTGESDVTSTFLNFDKNKTNEDRRYWYENLDDDADRMLKSKTDILSHLLKMHIDRLRNETNQVDLKIGYISPSPFFFLNTIKRI